MVENTEEGKDSNVKPKKRKFWKYSIWQYSTLALVILLAISIISRPDFSGAFTGSSVLSQEEVATKAVDYINTNLVQGTKVVSKGIIQENGLYKMELEIGSKIFPVYLTEDGKLLFPQAINMEEPLVQTQQGDQQQAADVPKSDKPKVELFVMSHCPYGLQAEKGILPVASLLKEKIDFSIKFVDYAMHGDKEVYEELTQHCIETEQNDKFFDYLNCFAESGDSESCLTEAGVDKNKLEECKSRTDTQFGITEALKDQSSWSGGRFPPFNIYKELNLKYGVRGSPTLIVNGKEANSGRDPASYLRTICSAFNTAPGECSQTLSAAAPSPGFGGGASGSDGGEQQCG